MSKQFKRVEDFECAYPGCDKQAYGFAYWLKEGNPKIPLCRDHYELTSFISWIHKKLRH